MTLEIPQGKFGAYLFDCDGTLADTMPLHYRAWQQALARHDFHLEEHLYYQLGGVPAHELIAHLSRSSRRELPAQQIVAEKEAAYITLAVEAQPIPAVKSVVERCAGKMPMAVASGGGRASVTATLRAIGLLEYFEVIVTSEDVRRGKPDPETFLTAAERLGVPPHACLVFEDAPPGIQAARSAGMQCVHVPSRSAITL